MKKVLFLAIAMLVACSVSFAQDAKEIMKERKAIQKMAKQELAAGVNDDSYEMITAKTDYKIRWFFFGGER